MVIPSHSTASKLAPVPEPTNKHAVLHLPELVETILLETPAIELLTSIRSVCRLWTRIIATSPAIQTYLQSGYKDPWTPSHPRDSFILTPLAHQILRIYYRKVSRLLVKLGDLSTVISEYGLEGGDQTVKNNSGEGTSEARSWDGEIFLAIDFYWKRLCALKRLYLQFQPVCQNITLFSGMEESTLAAILESEGGDEIRDRAYKLWMRKKVLEQIFPVRKSIIMPDWILSSEDTLEESRCDTFSRTFESMSSIEGGDGNTATGNGEEYLNLSSEKVGTTDVPSALVDILGHLAYWAYYKDCVMLDMDRCQRAEHNEAMRVWLLNALCDSSENLPRSWFRETEAGIERLLGLEG